MSSNTFPLTESRKFPSVPKNVDNKPNSKPKPKPKHHSMNPIVYPPETEARKPDQNISLSSRNLPINVKRLLATMNASKIVCTGITKQSTGAYILHTNGENDYVINGTGGIIKINKRKPNKTRNKKSRNNKTRNKSKFRK